MMNKLKSKYNSVNPICIECCSQIESLYKVYKDGFIDIVQCSNCNEIVDKYIECEYSVLLIDLILFKKTAYRHIIFNRIVMNALLLRFLLIFLLCDAYLQWFHVKNRQFESIKADNQQLFYELETGFYIMLLNSIFENLTYLVLISIFVLLLNGKSLFKAEFNLMVKSLIISSFGKLMVLPLVIWNPNLIFFKLANLFTYLSNAHGLAVSTSLDDTKAMCVCLVCNLLRILLNGYSTLFN